MNIKNNKQESDIVVSYTYGYGHREKQTPSTKYKTDHC